MDKLIRSVFLFVSLLSISCAGLDSLQPGAGKKIIVDNHSFDQVWSASLAVMSRNLKLAEVLKDAGIIKGEVTAGLFTYGEVVGLFITKNAENNFTIEVLSRKKLQTQVTGGGMEDEILEGIKKELNL